MSRAYNVLKGRYRCRIVAAQRKDYAMLKAFNGYYAPTMKAVSGRVPAHRRAEGCPDSLPAPRMSLFRLPTSTISQHHMKDSEGLPICISTPVLAWQAETPHSAQHLMRAEITVDRHNGDAPDLGRAITAIRKPFIRSTSTAAITEITAGGQKHVGITFSLKTAMLFVWCASPSDVQQRGLSG